MMHCQSVTLWLRLQIALASAILVSTISASALCGILVLIAVVPISKNLGKPLQRLVQGSLLGRKRSA